LTLGFQVLIGLLFGLLGFVLAVPLLAVVMVLVGELYVNDVLGGPARDADAS
jgi:predicted PurR-regulated permease PerM